jgi:thiamine biosynthesis lipoprotein ApbE
MRWCNTVLQFSLIVLVLCGGVFAPGAQQKTASANERQFVYKKKYAMGTVYEIVAYSPSLNTASRAIEAAFGEIANLDRVMSNYDVESDLSHLDRSAHFRVARVPPDLFRAIQDSLIYSRLSNGKYDVTVAPLVDLWKAAMVTGQAPSRAQISRLRKCVGYQKVQLIPPDSIEFHSGCMRIDRQGLRGRSSRRSLAYVRHPQCPDRRGREHALWYGRAPRSKRLARAIMRSLWPHRAGSDSPRRKHFYVGAGENQSD